MNSVYSGASMLGVALVPKKNLERAVAKLRVGLGPRNSRLTMESTYFEKTQK